MVMCSPGTPWVLRSVPPAPPIFFFNFLVFNLNFN